MDMMHRIFILLLLLSRTVGSQRIEEKLASAMVNASAIAAANRCAWSACKVIGYGSTYSNYNLDCCTLQLPLNYANPNGTIAISMSRLRPNISTALNNTVFVLDGGPGESGWNLLPLMTQIIPYSLGITIILPDHRGTGLSTSLGCNDNGSQDITASCIPYLISKYGLTGLQQFSITAAATDIGVQVQSYRLDAPGRICLFGVSYGTFWLDRVLQIYPTLVDAAVMDGVVNPLTVATDTSELWASAISSHFLSYCQAQVECNQRFPVGQPVQIVLRNIINDLYANKQTCINNNFAQYQITADTFRTTLFGMFQGAETYMDRTVIPAVIFRLARCNAEDVKVLSFFFQKSFATTNTTPANPNGPGFLHSNVLNYHIIQSEAWLAINASEVTEQTLVDWHIPTLLAPNITVNYITLRSQWPQYPLDQYHYQVATYQPLLMLSGTLDPSALFQGATQLASIKAKTRTFYGMPLLGHVTSNVIAVGYFCPAQLIAAWMFPNLVPSSWSDPACISSLPMTIDFVGNTSLGQQYSMKFLNVSLPFGTDPTPIGYINSSNRPTQPFEHSLLSCVFTYFIFKFIFA